ncbi:maleylpyruvate isomerase family mycothiol-dependent enzyme [Streptomyces cyanogenus]|uniref:Mycothiol-dependent maleylpyruvate isomerase n=1 Tax=Streptomyces cyanogenus TaxID=80860 RepID=A0ABX7U5M4_STRCY|nr:maleylpyruvate isomerase family mycothiol-dependent enzyme [Streptomyces cyanogenus]QTD95803.1 mycothiol-dependent maleylpyruvate isomerase [Streptomyces cyanogenus]QTE03187.1 mycothiol-dependent maleylpyruvate isomerase [Streptomyces cyanogenus]
MTDTPELDRADIAQLLDDVRNSAHRLRAGLDGLTDPQAREPSALPGWSRGHVLTHLARSADAYRWLLTLARTGTEPGPRADAAALDRALREGAGRDAAYLVTDLHRSLDRLFDTAAAMPGDRWATPVTALAGWRHPAWYTLHRAHRELETHHVDLNLGHTAADWPAGYVTRTLDETIAALTARSFPVARIEATDLGRSWTLADAGPTAAGPGHALLAWLTGRGPDAVVRSDRPLPAPPPWPQPPVPGWG